MVDAGWAEAEAYGEIDQVILDAYPEIDALQVARRRDRERCRAVLRRAKALRACRDDILFRLNGANSEASRWLWRFREQKHKAQTDRSRLRRVLARAKFWKHWYLKAGDVNLADFADWMRKNRWSKAWKAAAKGSRRVLVDIATERDELKYHYEEVKGQRDEALADWETARQSDDRKIAQLSKLERERDELAAKVRRAQLRATAYFNDVQTSDERLAEARQRVAELEKLLPRWDDLEQTVLDASEIRAIMPGPEVPYIEKMKKLVVAIRKHMEATDANS